LLHEAVDCRISSCVTVCCGAACRLSLSSLVGLRALILRRMNPAPRTGEGFP
jgi:hypothetical protein